MKQTAVDWLIEQLTPSISLQQKHIDELKEQAKEMEKEQIMNAVYDSMGTNFDANMGRAKLYYDTTYKQD